VSINEKNSLILTFTLKAIVIYFFNATLKIESKSWLLYNQGFLHFKDPLHIIR